MLLTIALHSMMCGWSMVSVRYSLGKYFATNYSLTFHDEYPSQTYCNFSLSQNCIVENGPSIMAREVDIQAFLASLAGRDLASAQRSLQLNHLWWPFQTPEFASEPLSK